MTDDQLLGWMAISDHEQLPGWVAISTNDQLLNMNKAPDYPGASRTGHARCLSPAKRYPVYAVGGIDSGLGAEMLAAMCRGAKLQLPVKLVVRWELGDLPCCSCYAGRMRNLRAYEEPDGTVSITDQSNIVQHVISAQDWRESMIRLLERQYGN